MCALRFKARMDSTYLYALSTAHGRFLTFTSGATSADLLTASMAAEVYHPLTCISGAQVQGLGCCCLTEYEMTDAVLTELLPLSSTEQIRYSCFA